jgi:hypothetical protein
MEQRMQGDTRIFFELCPDLLADLSDGGLSVWQIQILHQCLGELVGRDERFVEIPAKDISKLVRHRRLLLTVLRE